jgi:putative membrane protein
MKFIDTLGALGAILIVAGAPAMAAVPSQDKHFAVTAAQGGMAEVQAAQMARKKSHDPAVRAFAERMIADHTRANKKLTHIMTSQGLTPPASIDEKDRHMSARLSSLSGKAFDAAYLKDQDAAHKRMIALFKKEAESGGDRWLVSFANSTLPTLETHLHMANEDVASLGSTTASL